MSNLSKITKIPEKKRFQITNFSPSNTYFIDNGIMYITVTSKNGKKITRTASGETVCHIIENPESIVPMEKCTAAELNIVDGFHKAGYRWAMKAENGDTIFFTTKPYATTKKKRGVMSVTFPKTTGLFESAFSSTKPVRICYLLKNGKGIEK